MHLMRAITTVGLLTANVVAQLGQSDICTFNGHRGPNILVAVVKTPDGKTEIDAWLFGYNWCSHSNLVSKSGDICAATAARTVEFMHAPFTNRFGAFDPKCYANIDIQFMGCQRDSNGKFDYRNVVAKMTSKASNQMQNGAVEAAPNFAPQMGAFGQPPQGSFMQSAAGQDKMSMSNGQNSYTYQCVDDRELRACAFNAQSSPATEATYTAFMSCGVMAEP